MDLVPKKKSGEISTNLITIFHDRESITITQPQKSPTTRFVSGLVLALNDGVGSIGRGCTSTLPETNILLMEEILHQLVWRIFHFS